jgi:hypothetical protein
MALPHIVVYPHGFAQGSSDRRFSLRAWAREISPTPNLVVVEFLAAMYREMTLSSVLIPRKQSRELPAGNM